MDGLGGLSFEQWMTVLEWSAAGLGLINIALLVFRSHWNFAFGIASVALACFVFWERKLYAESSLQVFFVLAQAWGWWLWLRIGADDSKVPVRWLDWPSRAVWLTVAASLSLNLAWAMDRYTDAAAPYIDGPLAMFSMAAQFLLAFRRIENWVLWIVIDVFSVLLFIDREIYALAALYGAMLVMSLFGLKEWIEAERKQCAETQAA
jgi:nicotinamide mononucleotide transporter